ncbi:MAG: hypothetical protein JXA67_00475 [Micromonosporaceae bacterium]|nr:hypothetical protein [Micromonosporaceae bacterium]
MSFSWYARRVRDPGLPHRVRVSALRSCVQLYRPIGFHATLSFLRELAGPFDHEEAALVRALDALMASRAGWCADLECYAADRAIAKRRGRRCPGQWEPNPNRGPVYWYGAPHRAALHALRYWRRRRLPTLLSFRLDPAARQVLASVDACLAAGGALPPEDRRSLAEAVDALRRRLGAGLYHDDPAEYSRTRDWLELAGYTRIAADTPANPA